MIFTPAAPNIYEQQGRVCSHKHTPTPNKALRNFRPLLPRLKQLGVERVIYSELDRATGEWLGKHLDVPFEAWQSLNRFNAGKSHGINNTRWKELSAEMNKVWATKPDVPVKGGDSLTSFEKRMSVSRERLAKAPKKALVVAPKQVLESLLCGDMEYYHLYEAEL